MSRLVMLSDATGLRAYDGVVPAVRLASQHRSDYTACKDAAGRANTVETRHLTALRRIITASLLAVAKHELDRLRLGTGGINFDFAISPRRTTGRGRTLVGSRP
jgi:hypothetical protein